MAKAKLTEKLDSSEHEATINIPENDWTYINRLIIVAVAANEVIESADKSGRYYIRISRQRFNTLRRALEALRKQQQ